MLTVLGRTWKAVLAVVLLLVVAVPLALVATDAVPYKVYVIHTGSMTPTIPSTSAVVVREGSFRIGQVVSFTHAGEVITHRLVGRAPNGEYRTKGDANATADPWTLDAGQIIGRVEYAPPKLGYWIVYFRSPAGIASLFAGLICLLLISSITEDLCTDDAEPRRPKARHRATANRRPALGHPEAA